LRGDRSVQWLGCSEGTVGMNVSTELEDTVEIRQQIARLTVCQSELQTVHTVTCSYDETRRGELTSSMYLILSAALGSGVYSASNRNEC
jgi:hypothetical protein